MAGKYVLYEHRNKINGKRYIGITNNVTKRWYGKGKHYEGCPCFWNAIQKYGWDNFYHTILVYDLTLDEANRLEIYFIDRFKTCDKAYGYNIALGGTNAPTMLGKHHTEETKRKMREKAVGRTISDEQRKKHSEAMKGLMVGARNHKSTAVRCINTGEVFETQRSASEAKGVMQSKISLCCRGKIKQTHGLRWEFVERMEG